MGTPDDLDRLLENAVWVRALGVELVGAGEADDLVQDAWLVALEERGRALRPAAWLSGVVRRLAGRRRRGEARRSSRERAVARPEARPAADQLVAEAEIQRLLIEEVTRLDEPYRSTVLLRFYRGWTPEEIARHQSIPGATVRTRLARALAKLRERLDRARGGREAWALCLASPAGFGDGAAGAIREGVLMGAKAKLTGAAVVAGLASYGIWWAVAGAQEASARAEGLTAASPGPAGAAGARLGPFAVPSRATREAVASAAGPGAILGEVLLYGSVLDAHGEPVELEWIGVEDEHGIKRSASTPRPGSFAISGVAPGLHTLRARAEGFVSLREELLLRGDGEHQRHDLVLEPALSIPVKLVDDSGTLLTGWRQEKSGVPISVVATRTRPTEGLFGLGTVPGRTLGCGEYEGAEHGGAAGLARGYSGILRLRVPVPVHVSAVLLDTILETRLLDAPVDELVFTIDRGALAARLGGVRLRFVDALGGLPLREGYVGLDRPDTRGFGSTTVGEDGGVLLAARPPGLYRLRLRLAGYERLDRCVRIVPGECLELGDVPVWPAATIRGRVVDARGAPASASAFCAPLSVLRGPGDVASCVSQATAGGRFELENVARGPVRLLVNAPDHAWLSRTLDASSGLVDGLELRLEEGVPVLFRCGVDAAGRQLTLAGEDGVPFTTWTLVEGTFATRLSPGRYRILTGVAERIESVEELVVGEAPVEWTVVSGR